MKLFHRSAAGMAATREGAELAAGLSKGFREISSSLEKAAAAKNSGLTVSSVPIFASRWLVQRLQGFFMVQPEINLQLLAEDRHRTPGDGDVDLCIRIGKGSWPGVTAEKLFDHRVFPVCSPEIAAKLKRPEDLCGVPVLRDNGAMFDLDAWLKPEGLSKTDLNFGASFSDAALCMDAAMNNAGVFFAWDALALDPVSTGKLVTPFSQRHPTGNSYWLISGPGGVAGPAQSAFRDWLEGELSDAGLTLR